MGAKGRKITQGQNNLVYSTCWASVWLTKHVYYMYILVNVSSWYEHSEIYIHTYKNGISFLYSWLVGHNDFLNDRDFHVKCATCLLWAIVYVILCEYIDETSIQLTLTILYKGCLDKLWASNAFLLHQRGTCITHSMTCILLHETLSTM